MFTSFAVGTLIDDRYSIIELLGEGATGSVYKTRDQMLDRLVAVKLLHSSLLGDKKSRGRFERESKVLATLSHPHILQLYRQGVWQQNQPYIVMEYLEGRTLRQVLGDGETLELDRCLKIGIQICSAMDSAHAAGIIHRDISPGNIMLQDGIDDDQVKVIDFGLSLFKQGTAGVVNQQLTATSAVIGTAQYMSPEQCSGKKADHRSDIYSLACVIYQTITGVPPFDADTSVVVMTRHLSEPHMPLKAHIDERIIPAGLECVLSRALAKSPDERYQSMRDFGADLEFVASGAVNKIRSALNGSSARKRYSTLKKVTSIVLTLCTAILICTHVFSSSKNDSQSAIFTKSIAREVGRRLRTLKEISDSHADPISYYTSWLSSYQDADSIDVIDAQIRLAKELEDTDRGQVAKLVKSAANRCMTWFGRAINEKNSKDVHMIIERLLCLGSLVPYREPFVDILRSMLQQIENAGEENFPRAAFDIRFRLAVEAIRDQEWSKALAFLDVGKEFARNFLLGTDVYAEYIRERSLVLSFLGRKSESREQLQVALSTFRKLEVRPESLRHSLLVYAMRENFPDICLDIAREGESIYSWQGNEDELCASYQAHAKCLWILSRSREAFDVLESTSQHTRRLQNRLSLWRTMSQIDVSAGLKEAAIIAGMIQHYCDLLPTPAPDQQIVDLLDFIRETEEFYLECGDKEDVEKFLPPVATVRQKWRSNSKDVRIVSTVVQLSAIVQDAGCYRTSTEILSDILSRAETWQIPSAGPARILLAKVDGLPSQIKLRLISLLRQKGELRQASSLLDEQAKISPPIQNRAEYFHWLVRLSVHFRELNRPAESHRFAMKAVDFAKRLGRNEYLIESYVCFAQAEVLLGDPQSALRYLNLADNICTGPMKVSIAFQKFKIYEMQGKAEVETKLFLDTIRRARKVDPISQHVSKVLRVAMTIAKKDEDQSNYKVFKRERDDLIKEWLRPRF